MASGYRYVCQDGRKIALHRLIVQQREGRVLTSDEVVHHVDHDRLNNSPDNLVILSRSEHQRLHTAGVKKRRWNEAEKRRAKELHTAGMSIQEVSRLLNRPFSSTALHVGPRAK
jgi:hypothetical protein